MPVVFLQTIVVPIGDEGVDGAALTVTAIVFEVDVPQMFDIWQL